MIELSCSRQGLSRRLLAAPGGFLWWYVDLIDEFGDGLVVIWSFGLPFLPGYADAARRGRGQLPADRPSLNISWYRRGEITFYLLQEFEPDEVVWNRREGSSVWRFGASSLRSERVDGERRVELDLRLDVPAMQEEARFTLEAAGPEVQGGWEEETLSRRESDLPEHDWKPLLCAVEGQAFIDIGEGEEIIRGRVYHDRNGGCLPLHELGIAWWAWGRVAMEEGEFIYFVLDGREVARESVFLQVEPDGAGHRLPGCRVTRERMTKSLLGLRSWRSVVIEHHGEPWLELDFDTVDAGPFYQRSLLRARDGGGRLRGGFAEFCEPDRVDLSRFRRLIEMRVHRRGGHNSMWLPLFSGPRDGRVQRLLRSLRPGGPRSV